MKNQVSSLVLFVPLLSLPLSCVSSTLNRGGFQQSELLYSYPPAAAKRPKHPLSIAILPILDERTHDEGLDSAHRYTYRGKTFGFTDVRGLKKGLGHSLTTIIGRQISLAAIFEKVVIVDRSEQAEGVDLLMSANISRARGYVQRFEPSAPQGGQPTKSQARPQKRSKPRQVMSEFVLSDVKVVDRRDSGSVFLNSDFGWSVLDERTVENEALVAWTVLGEAIRNAVDQLLVALRESDYSGETKVLERVQFQAKQTSEGPFGALSNRGPPGWQVMTSSSALRAPYSLGPDARQAGPIGWLGAEIRCQKLELRAKQSWRFHRVLGPYRPTVILWRCPAASRFRYDVRAAHVAEYLGSSIENEHFFMQALGETNWKTSRADIRAHLGIQPPSDRYLFEIGPPR